MADGDINIMRR